MRVVMMALITFHTNPKYKWFQKRIQLSDRKLMCQALGSVPSTGNNRQFNELGEGKSNDK